DERLAFLRVDVEVHGVGRAGLVCAGQPVVPGVAVPDVRSPAGDLSLVLDDEIELELPRLLPGLLAAQGRDELLADRVRLRVGFLGARGRGGRDERKQEYG